MTTISAPKDLAHQAFEMYDTAGEEAMLSFLLLHERHTDTEESNGSRLYRLTDGTAVHHLNTPGPYTVLHRGINGHYTVLHRGINGHYRAIHGSEDGRIRPAEIADEHQPAYVDMQRPLLGAPNAASVVRELLAWAEQQAREHVGLIYDDDFLDLYDAASSMPELQEAINKALELSEDKPLPGRKIYDYLDAVVSEIATDTLEFLPLEQRELLVERAKAKLEKIGQTEAELQAG